MDKNWEFRCKVQIRDVNFGVGSAKMIFNLDVMNKEKPNCERTEQ